MGEELAQLSEREKVEAWRFEQFDRMGYDATAAERLARSEADLHRVASLLSGGCSLELAAEIAV